MNRMVKDTGGQISSGAANNAHAHVEHDKLVGIRIAHSDVWYTAEYFAGRVQSFAPRLPAQSNIYSMGTYKAHSARIRNFLI
ncbi:hypothetical protein RSAG8_02944, partial [Rhizoctonia solani AG-8 WAC10335]